MLKESRLCKTDLESTSKTILKIDIGRVNIYSNAIIIPASSAVKIDKLLPR